MSWNPWADNRYLRALIDEWRACATARQDIICGLDIARRRLTDRIEALEQTNAGLRLEIYQLRAQTHRRDPKTGRILPKGK